MAKHSRKCRSRVYDLLKEGNASAHPSQGSVATAKAEILKKSIEVNFLGNVYAVRHVAEAMSDDGSIILFLLDVDHPPSNTFFPYSYAKAATDCLVKYAAVEYGARGIRVDSILPGAIRTEMSKTVVFSDASVGDAYRSEVPLGRIGEPVDFVNTVLWLAGPSFVTGQNFHVSGGNQLTRFPQPYDFGTRSTETVGKYK